MEALFLEAVRLDPKLARARRELILLYAMQARRVVADYIAGMTDRFAIEEHRRLTDPSITG